MKSPIPADIAALPFEKALAELETIVGRLEKGDVPLEESIALYARGDALRRGADAIAVIGGFIMAGGHVGSLIQPTELIMIGGAAAGAFVVTNTGKVIKSTLSALPTVFKGSKFTKALYIELLCLLFDILAKVRKEGLMSIESDVEAPDQSPLFSKYPMIVADHHAMEFLTDRMRGAKTNEEFLLSMNG